MAARRKTVTVPVEKFGLRRVRVLVAFGDLKPGDETDLPLNPCVQGWINAGLAKVVDDGTGQAGQGRAEQDDPGGVAGRTGDNGAAGDEQGEGPGAG